ncbi:MAG: ComEC/Rec2 family competence protein [Bacteroidetes bacterium]|nr:ComEC/Rec2 family competence protein [Bacteroidota bacterium]
MHTSAFPFLRIAGFLVTGIYLGLLADRPIAHLELVLISGVLLMAPLASRTYRFSHRWFFGLYLGLWYMAAGYELVLLQDERRQADHFSNTGLEPQCVLGMVYDAPVPGARVKLRLQVWANSLEGKGSQACSGNMILYLSSDSLSNQLRYGDVLELWVQPELARPPGNPHAFDYSRYLYFQNIHFQSFVKQEAWRLAARNRGAWIWRLAYSARDQTLRVLARYMHGADENAVAGALLLGYKENLSESIRDAYANTGSMHALAVSGSHVSMLYVGLLYMFGFFQLRGRWGRFLEFTGLMLAIWAFTCITGATASVLRASVMFSIYLFGKLIFRISNAWNVLAFSAFVLLLQNPYLLGDAGFQLSYAAVAGMVFFYPRLYKISPLMPKWLDGAWSVLLVGISAQLGTLPLSLYYFHQFPFYFWLSGWMVVWGGAIFLWGGSLLILLDACWLWGAQWLAWMLEKMLWAMNQGIFIIQNLPGSVLDGIWMETVELFLGYVGLICLGGTMVFKSRNWFLALLVTCLTIWAIRLQRQYVQECQKELVVYEMKKGRLVDAWVGLQCITLSDTLTEKAVSWAAENNRWAHGIYGRESAFFAQDTFLQKGDIGFKPPFVQFGRDRMLFLRMDQAVPLDTFRVSVLVVGGKFRKHYPRLLGHYPCTLLVADAQTAPWQIADWEQYCLEHQIAFYSIGRSGAFHWPLQTDF